MNSFRRNFRLTLLLLWSAGVSLAVADQSRADDGQGNKSPSLLTSIQYGRPTQYFSQKLYSNFNTAALNLTYEKEGPYLKFSGAGPPAGILPAWNSDS